MRNAIRTRDAIGPNRIGSIDRLEAQIRRAARGRFNAVIGRRTAQDDLLDTGMP